MEDVDGRFGKPIKILGITFAPLSLPLERRIQGQDTANVFNGFFSMYFIKVIF
jgi:hypothetical protein